VILTLSVTFASPRERSGRKKKEVKLDSQTKYIDSAQDSQEYSREFR
jgi:hypothetical protein